MTEPLTYECPHCRANVPVDPAVLGEAVACPSCNREFEAALPKGRPVGNAVDPGGPATTAVGNTSAGPTTATVHEEADEETVLHKVHPALLRAHPLRSLGFLLLGVAGAVAVAFGLLGNTLFGIEASVLWIAGLAMIVVAALYVAWAKIMAQATTLTVTTKRTILEHGLFNKNTSEVQHDDVRNIKSDRSFLERTFGYGDIALSSSGQDEMEIVVKDIPNPQELIETVRRHQ